MIRPGLVETGLRWERRRNLTRIYVPTSIEYLCRDLATPACTARAYAVTVIDIMRRANVTGPIVAHLQRRAPRA